MGSGVSRPAPPPPQPPSSWPLALHLLAVFVVIHAGERLVRIAVDVRVRSTHVPVPCPAHVTLGGSTQEVSAAWLGVAVPCPGLCSLHWLSSQAQASPFLLRRHSGHSRHIFTALHIPPEPFLLPPALGLHYLARHCPIAFKETVSVGMAGAVGWAVAGPRWEAALALVSQETQAAGTTFEGPLGVGR